MMASQMSCGAKSSALSCGRPPFFSTTCATSWAVSAASAAKAINAACMMVSRNGRPPLAIPRERARSRSAVEDDECDEQPEQARGLGERETDQKVRELAGSGGRVAHRARQVVAEDVADADAGPDQGAAGEARANHLCSCEIHVRLLIR